MTPFGIAIFLFKYMNIFPNQTAPARAALLQFLEAKCCL